MALNSGKQIVSYSLSFEMNVFVLDMAGIWPGP
jgi:hypothetical protein